MRPSPLPLVLALAACQEFTITPGDKDPIDVPEDSDVVIPVGQPDIQVSPEELRFGGLPPSCPAEPQTITIANKGDAKLQVSGAELKGLGNGAFTLSEPGPWTVPPGKSVDVEVSFTPLDYFTYDRVRIAVTSDDPDEEVVEVATLGEGADAVFREERFDQGLASKVDVLWVIDTSESMVDEQQKLGQAINVFIRSFVNLGLDYHIGVTSTDVTNTGLDGELAGPWMYGSSSGGMTEQQVITEFKSQANLGAGGSADEKGFAAMKRALTAPRTNNAPNQGFLRPDATLAVVAISDEDDREATGELSGTMNAQTVNQYVSWLQGLKADPGDVTFSAMAGPASGGLSACGFTGGATAAPAYNKAARDTYGVWSSICTFDINPFLTHLSFVAAGLEFRFELSDTPASFSPSAITVTVDGQAVPYGAVDGWTYDQTTNAIELHGSAIPDPGESVVISYPVEGSCAP